MYALQTIDGEAFSEAVVNGQPYQPLYVKFKLVWTCNLRCVMCNHWRDRRAPPLRIDRLRSIVDELAALGCRKIHITGGEPTLHPDLIAFIAHITAHNIRVTMTTNATLIDKPLAKALAGAGLAGVNVSIDSPDRQIHDRIRGVHGSWKAAVRGARYLSRALKPGKMRINAVIGRKNYRTMIDLPDFALHVGAGAINLIPMDIHTAEARPLNAHQIHEFNREIAPLVAEKALAAGLIRHRHAAFPFGMSEAEIDHSRSALYAQGYYEQHRCYAPWTHALIDHEGQVLVCCMLRERPVLGSLREQSFHDIWTGENFARLRAQTDLPLFPMCRHCDMFIAQNQRLDALVQLKSIKVSSSSESNAS